MPNIDRLPTRKDGVDGLLRLAETFGKKEVYELILLCRTARTRATDDAGTAMRTLALDLVDEEMDAGMTYDEARRKVSDDLGYSHFREGNGRSNFYQLIRGGRTADQRPKASSR